MTISTNYGHYLFFKLTSLKNYILLFLFSILFFSTSLLAQEDNIPDITVKGVVKDNQGNSIPGVAIYSKNNPSKGVVADVDGVFSIKLTQADKILIFTSIGFMKKEVKLKGRKELNITLKENIGNLDELVVVGYGKQKKVNITGAIDVVSGEELKDRATRSAISALQGTTPSLKFNYGSTGTEPGSAPRIFIRGLDRNPYVLIDGIESSLSDINQNDIASINILKDASAAAIYGARAAYGVVLITTKSGTKDLKINYSNNISFSRPTTMFNHADSWEFARVFNEAITNSGNKPIFTEEYIEALKKLKTGEEHRSWDKNKEPERYGSMANTNWYNVYFKDYSFQQKHNIAISKRGEVSDYYVSLGYFHEKGLLRYSSNGFKQFNANLKYTLHLSKWLDFTINTRYINKTKSLPTMGHYGGLDYIYHNIARKWPTLPLYDPNNNYSYWSGIGMRESSSKVLKNNHLRNTFTIKAEPVKNWQTVAKIAYNNYGGLSVNHQSLGYYYNEDNKKIPFPDTYPGGVYKNMSNGYYYNIGMNSNYKFTINDNHNIKVMLGYQEEYNKYRSVYAGRQELFSDNFPSINNASGKKTTSEEWVHHSTRGFFGRLNYDYKGRYLLEGSARYDGSSKFKKGQRWGFFPSFSLGWNFHKEPFMENIAENIGLNTFKIRASYGLLGNQKVDDYLYLPIVESGEKWFMMNDKKLQYISFPSIISKRYTWEKMLTTNIGLDIAFFDNRLTGTCEFFRYYNYDILGPVGALPSLLGTSPPKENNVAKETLGWEFSLSWKDRLDNGFSYSIGMGISDSRRFFRKYYNPSKSLSYAYEGREIGEMWGYETDGLFLSDEEVKNHADQSIFYAKWGPGDTRYVDLNKDGKIDWGKYTLDDHGDMKIIGNSSSRYMYNFSLSADYKGFSLSALWQGIGKKDIWFDSGTNLYWGISGGIWQSSVLEHTKNNYWSKSNLSAMFPKTYMSNEVYKNRKPTARYMQSGAYLRLKNLTLSYNLPTNFINIGGIGIRNLKIYLTAENLLTFHSLPEGFDPEALSARWGTAGKMYPMSKIYSIGINLTL